METQEETALRLRVIEALSKTGERAKWELYSDLPAQIPSLTSFFDIHHRLQELLQQRLDAAGWTTQLRNDCQSRCSGGDKRHLIRPQTQPPPPPILRRPTG